MTIRRVVTGLDEHGREAFLTDTQLEEVPNVNTMLTSLWRTAGDLQIPPKVAVEDQFGFPEPGGAWIMSWTVPPHSVAGEEGGGTTQAGELPTGGAHATESIDVNIVLEGSIVFQLGDGSETVLARGDSIVVNGVMHTWRNPGDETARMLSVLFGAQRSNG